MNDVSPAVWPSPGHRKPGPKLKMKIRLALCLPASRGREAEEFKVILSYGEFEAKLCKETLAPEPNNETDILRNVFHQQAAWCGFDFGGVF